MSRAVRLGLFAALAAAVVAPYFALDGEREAMDDAARAAPAVKRSGAYVRLTDGVTHYEVGGPEAGERVVLVHGASGPYAVWDYTFDALTAAGYRVLRYDLYGRGGSDRPAATYDLAFYRKQLDELLGQVGFAGHPLTAIGSSMGGIITADLATRSGDVERAVLIGVAGFPIEANPAAKLLPVPGVGDYVMTVTGDRMLKKHNRKYYYAPDRFPEAHEQFAEQMKYKGYKRAILSTMRSMPMNDFAAGYRALGATNKPVLLVWGREDQTFPYPNLEVAKGLVPQARAGAVTVEEAGHVPMYEQPGVVSAAVLEFLRANPLRGAGGREHATGAPGTNGAGGDPSGHPG
jgi:pimeloyl-ACP methyl ester carboxylesterase